MRERGPYIYPLRGLYRALIPSVPTKNQGDARGFLEGLGCWSPNPTFLQASEPSTLSTLNPKNPEPLHTETLNSDTEVLSGNFGGFRVP